MASVAENITRHYRGEWHGSYGLFPTPGHSSKDRGMKVMDGATGDVVISSFNGGDWREIKDECRKAGLLPDRERSADHPAWRDVARYEYADANGAVLYRTVRREKPGEAKRFVAQRLEGTAWMTGLEKVERVPYRLPELLAADPDQVVYFVEGERKADKLVEMGFVATAIAFGCKGWRDDYVSYLAGRKVAVLPDNDDVGRVFADQVAAAVRSAGGVAAIVELPGLPPKGDVIDWVKAKCSMGAGGSAFDLRALTDIAFNPVVETFDIADLTAWANTTPTPKAFVMPGFIPKDDVVIITGDGGTNKSTLALQISACAAAGKPFLGVDVVASPALYITAEDDNRENHWRLAKIATTIGTTLQALAGRLHVVSLRGRLNNELATFEDGGKLRVATAYKLLRSTIEKTGAKLVTLDNVAHLFPGNENDRGQVTAFINLLYQLCGDFGVTILLIAHRNKAGDTYSGSTAWLNAVRSQVLMERSEDDADVRRISLGKANYARAGEEMSCRWHDFALVRDADLSPDMRAQIAEVAATNSANQAFLDCLAAAVKQGLHVSANVSPSYAPSRFEGMPEAKGMKKDKLALAMKRLLSIGKVEQIEVYDTTKGRSSGRLQTTPNATPERFPQTFPNDPELPSQTTPPTYGYINIPDAALGVPAPSHEEAAEQPKGRPRGKQILAPGETGNEPVPGFEDFG
ncbi:AAA family ATPase [Sphingomonas faeni]|uniref:AAA family ATPase n=1 Tax=Sphingomonas faeni TaxID=185950 RepID=UPI0020BEBC81|nr:AAA family ATPase [Sphingomonas faeni]MCK8457038.1 AAA family ATPase [Sphingomonas faeni]